jgi:membrane protein
VDTRERSAGSPANAPPHRRWVGILRAVVGQVKKDRLSIIAAGVAFYALLAIFPALMAMVALYGLLVDPAQLERHFASVAAFLPPEAASILLGQLSDLTQTGQTALGLGAIAGLVLALWSASAGVRTLMEALNVAYDETERRSFLKFYGTALLLTLAAIAGVAVAIGTVVAIPVVLRFVGLGETLKSVVSYARWPIIAAAVMLGIAFMYRFGPSRDRRRSAWITWGAAIATALWLGASSLFSLYVTKFADYNETYGSAGAVVVLLMWLLLSAYAVLIGAEIDSEMERQAPADMEGDEPRPRDERSAHAGDAGGGRR